MDDQAERKETKNGCPSRKNRNEQRTTQPKGSTNQSKGKKGPWATQPKGMKQKIDDLAERKEKNDA